MPVVNPAKLVALQQASGNIRNVLSHCLNVSVPASVADITVDLHSCTCSTCD